jgi:hypothetical protein
MEERKKLVVMHFNFPVYGKYLKDSSSLTLFNPASDLESFLHIFIPLKNFDEPY